MANMILCGGFLVLIKLFFGYGQDVHLTCPESDLFDGTQINLICAVSTSYSSKCAALVQDAEFRVSYEEHAYIPLCRIMDVSQCYFNPNTEGCGCVNRNNTHYTLKYTFIGALSHNITWDCFINCLDENLNPALTYDSKFCKRRNVESISVPQKTIAQYCTDGEFTCTDGQCIEYDRSCDGREDCSDGIDEFGCETVETTASTTQVTTSHGHHDITCTESRMEFSIPLSSPHTSETATLSDPNCQINLTRTHVRGGVDLNSCGTTVQFQNDSVIFRNAIIFSAPASSSLGSNGSDDSVSQYQDIIPIECVYNRIATVHLSYMPVVRRVLFTESGVGQFSFNIQQFWDASFTSVVSDRAYPLRLEQDADIFIQLSVGSEGQPVAGHKEIGMEVQQCLVSPSSSVIEAQLHYYPLIQDGCPASSDVHIIPNTNASDSTVMRFRFRAVNFFDPSSSSSSSLVFVHCRMGLCLTGSCKPSAWTCLTPPARRVRRDVDQSRRAAHQLSTGPFLIMADEASASSSSTTATVMAVVSTSVATVAIVVAAIALIALRRRRTTARN